MFRKKNTPMLYPHPELAVEPIQALEEATKIKFSLDKLPPVQRAAFEAMYDKVLSKKHGEPLDVAENIFKEYQTKEYDSDKLRINMTTKKLWFDRKLEVMNDEFDSYIGALVASLVLKQHCLRAQA